MSQSNINKNVVQKPQSSLSSLANSNNNQNNPSPKITYDDILSSLNMKMVNGTLQIARNPVLENIKAGNENVNQIGNPYNHNNTEQLSNNLQQPKKTVNFNPILNDNQFKNHQLQQGQGQGQGQEQQEMPILTEAQLKQLKRIQMINYLQAVKKQEQRNQQIKALKPKNMQFF